MLERYLAGCTRHQEPDLSFPSHAGPCEVADLGHAEGGHQQRPGVPLQKFGTRAVVRIARVEKSDERA